MSYELYSNVDVKQVKVNCYKLRTLIREAKIPVSEIAMASGVSMGGIYNVLNGNNEFVRVSTLAKICDAIGEDFRDYILDDGSLRRGVLPNDTNELLKTIVELLSEQNRRLEELEYHDKRMDNSLSRILLRVDQLRGIE